MSKRFTDTTIWFKQWFRKLPVEEKTAWAYIVAQCDAVGVWDADLELAEILIGKEIDWKHLRENCNGNLRLLDNGKWWVVDFCHFQYGPLDDRCKPHSAYIRLLITHGLLEEVGATMCRTGEDSYKTRRNRLNEAKRRVIKKRDKYTCQYCGKVDKEENLTVDHIIPLTHGGVSDDMNLVTACPECNAGKMTKDVLEFLNERGFRASERVYKAIHSLKEKEKEQEKELEKEQEKDKRTTNVGHASLQAIGFNWEAGLWRGITDDELRRWAEAYPLVDVEQELAKQAQWLLADPRRKKTNYRRFITNWLAKAQDRARTPVAVKR